jgi:hypothetical protein
MDDSFPKLDRAHTVCGGHLVETTPEVNREVAESAMLLSQGARRAIEMKREAKEAAVSAASANANQKPPDSDDRLQESRSPGALRRLAGIAFIGLPS